MFRFVLAKRMGCASSSATKQVDPTPAKEASVLPQANPLLSAASIAHEDGTISSDQRMNVEDLEYSPVKSCSPPAPIPPAATTSSNVGTPGGVTTASSDTFSVVSSDASRSAPITGPSRPPPSQRFFFVVTSKVLAHGRNEDKSSQGILRNGSIAALNGARPVSYRNLLRNGTTSRCTSVASLVPEAPKSHIDLGIGQHNDASSVTSE